MSAADSSHLLASTTAAPSTDVPSLAALLERSDIWTGARLASQGETLSSGFPALDAELPGGGWPRGALIDLLHQKRGIGELSLLLPALAQLTARDEWVLLLAPPERPFAPAWAAAGVALSRLIIVAAPSGRGEDKRATDDCLWAAEQILRAGSVSAALMWLPTRTAAIHLRRLQLAAESGGSCGFFLQNERRLAAASPAPLRLQLSPLKEPGQLAVRIVKRRGPPLMQTIELSLPRSWRRQRAIDSPSSATRSDVTVKGAAREVEPGLVVSPGSGDHAEAFAPGRSEVARMTGSF
jgi:protein ImuA